VNVFLSTVPVDSTFTDFGGEPHHVFWSAVCKNNFYVLTFQFANFTFQIGTTIKCLELDLDGFESTSICNTCNFALVFSQQFEITNLFSCFLLPYHCVTINDISCFDLKHFLINILTVRFDTFFSNENALDGFYFKFCTIVPTATRDISPII